MAPRRVLPLVGALLLVLAARGEADAPRLRGSVACLDCAAGHDLSGVVVAVRCGAGAGAGAGILRAAQTDARGAFDVAMPAAAAPTSSSSATPCAAQTDARGAFDVAMPAAAAPTSSSSATPCAARILGATEQLCAPRGLAVARVVPARAASPASSYALGSPLAFFAARCRPGPASGSSGSAVATTTDDAPDQQRQRDAPRVPPPARPAPPEMQAPGGAPPRAGGNTGPPPFGVGGGLPLIFFFPFIPIIGIP